jgi:hypothetical protein
VVPFFQTARNNVQRSLTCELDGSAGLLALINR